MTGREDMNTAQLIVKCNQPPPLIVKFNMVEVLHPHESLHHPDDLNKTPLIINQLQIPIPHRNLAPTTPNQFTLIISAP